MSHRVDLVQAKVEFIELCQPWLLNRATTSELLFLVDIGLESYRRLDFSETLELEVGPHFLVLIVLFEVTHCQGIEIGSRLLLILSLLNLSQIRVRRIKNQF